MASDICRRKVRRNFFGVLTAATGCAAVAGFAALSAPPAKVVRANVIETASITASNTTLGFADSDIYFQTPAQVATTLNMMQSIGVNSVRIMIPWAGVEPLNGSYNWTQIDTIVNDANARGMSVIGMIDETPGWAAKAGTPALSGPPASDAVFAAFASKLATRYTGKISAYEIWNEPNSKTFWSTGPSPAAYTALLKAAYTAIKKADPKATVIAGALSSVPTTSASMDPVSFLKAMYADGAKGYFDELSFHPYSTSEFSTGLNVTGQPLNELQAMRNLMIANGDTSKQIWATEYGLPSYPYGQTKQATFIQDFLTKWRTITYVGPEYIYTAQDYTGSTFGVWTTGWTAKPAVAVIKSFTGGAVAAVQSMALALTVSTDPSSGQTVAGLVPTVVNAAVNAAMVVPKAAMTAGATAMSTGLGIAGAAEQAVSTGLTQLATGLEQAAASAATKHATTALTVAKVTAETTSTTTPKPKKPKKSAASTSDSTGTTTDDSSDSSQKSSSQKSSTSTSK
jgi:arabinogalactan endo-1,4-beta-galactosidase